MDIYLTRYSKPSDDGEGSYDLCSRCFELLDRMSKQELTTVQIPGQGGKLPGVQELSRQDRKEQLRELFEMLDVDNTRYIEAAELMMLGQARRPLGHPSGAWTEDKNSRLVSRMDVSGQGKIKITEFVEHFDNVLPRPEVEFDEVIAKFGKVAKGLQTTAHARFSLQSAQMKKLLEEKDAALAALTREKVMLHTQADAQANRSPFSGSAGSGARKLTEDVANARLAQARLEEEKRQLIKQASEMKKLVDDKDSALVKMSKDKKRIADESAAREDKLRIALSSKSKGSERSAITTLHQSQVAALESDKARLIKQAANMKRLVDQKDAALAEVEAFERQKATQLKEAAVREMQLQAALQAHEDAMRMSKASGVQVDAHIQQLTREVALNKQQMIGLQHEKTALSMKVAEMTRMVDEKDAALTAMAKEKNAIDSCRSLLSPAQVATIEAENLRLSSTVESLSSMLAERDVALTGMEQYHALQLNDAEHQELRLQQALETCDTMVEENSRLSELSVRTSRLAEEKDWALSAMAKDKATLESQAATREKNLQDALESREKLVETLREQSQSPVAMSPPIPVWSPASSIARSPSQASSIARSLSPAIVLRSGSQNSAGARSGSPNADSHSPIGNPSPGGSIDSSQVQPSALHKQPSETLSQSLQQRAEGIATSYVFRESSPGKHAVMSKAQAKEAM